MSDVSLLESDLRSAFTSAFDARHVDHDSYILDYLVSVSSDALRHGRSLSSALEHLLIAYDAVHDLEHAHTLVHALESKHQISRHTEVETEREGRVMAAPVRIAEHTSSFKAKKDRVMRKDRVMFVSASDMVKEKKEKKSAFIEAKKAILENEGNSSALTISASVASGGASAKSRTVNLTGVSLAPIDGGDLLLQDSALRFVDGRRYGLIGRNGVGKTTLLKAVARGEIRGFPESLRVVHVQQEISGTDQIVLDVVMSADVLLKSLLDEEKKLSESKEDSDRLQEVHLKLEELDGWSAESRACSILSGLQFTNEMIHEYKTRDLSGGWRMRVALASALFVNPDLLLLDEPTNHLDFPAVVWLEGFLQKYGKTVVVVSHDRYFLNNVVTDIIHFHHQKLDYYRGDYSSFEKTKAEKAKQLARNAESVDKKMKHMQTFIDRFRYNANRAAMVQSRIKTLNKLAASSDFLEDLVEDPTFRFEFPVPEPLGKEIISVNDVEFGYGNGPSLLQHISLRLDMESRIAVLGRNGAGKTTLLNLIMGLIEPRKGTVSLNNQARISMFSQHHVDQLDLSMSPQEYMQYLYPSANPQELRNHLGRYGMSGDLALRPIGKLSGGQKSRVSFSCVTWNNPHLLVLDEPTNHCDLETVDALIFAISVFQGGVVAVSHDQHFMNNCASEFWAVTDKSVHVYYSFQEAKAFTYKKQIL